MEYPKFKVCVRCFTFNQAKFIEETMNGFVMQQTDFPFVCCIVDDASTDGEQDVIKKYMDMHFDYSPNSVSFEKETDYAYIHYAQHKKNKNCYFAVLFLKENLYSKNEGFLKKMYIAEWRDNCIYEAICEGDDYWISSFKLKKQVAYMDEHPSCGMCYTCCKYFNQKQGVFEKESWGGPYTEFNDLLKECTVPTLTVLLRLKMLKQYEKEGHDIGKGWLMGDYPMWLWFSHETSIYFFNDITSVYRVLENSASHSSALDVQEKFIYSTYDMLSYFCNLYNCKNMLPPDWLYHHLFNTAVMYGDKDKAKEYYIKIIHPTIKQKIKYRICCNLFLYKVFASRLFYTK